MIAFQNNRKSLSELRRPQIDQQLDIKSRVGVLEGIVEFQEKINPLNAALADNLYSEISVIEARMLRVIEQNQQDAAVELAELKRHYNHRYYFLARRSCPLTETGLDDVEPRMKLNVFHAINFCLSLFRFDLQIADNLRNVQHISALKTENIQLRKRLVSDSRHT